MATSMPQIWIITYSVMDGCAHTTYISCIWDIICTYLRRFSSGGVFSWTRSRKAFHPSLSLGPHALGGICYTTIFHHPCNSPSRTIGGLIPWLVSSDMTWNHFHDIPLNMSFHFPEDISVWKTLKTSLFCIGTGSQFSTRANGGNHSNRARQLALCLRVTLVPTILRSVFKK